MTVADPSARVRFVCNGVTTLFQVFWPLVDLTHLLVYRRPVASDTEELLIPGTHYTVVPPTGPWPDGLLVSIPLGAKNANGDTIAIVRSEPIRQNVDYVENDAFPAASHEGALDYLTYLAARCNERLDRALIIRPTDPLGGASAQFNAMNARIANVADPVADTDAATKLWVLAQISNPVGWTPDKDVAQWNADRLQGRAVASTAPTDGYVLKWVALDSRWEPQPAGDAASLLSGNNVWTGINTYSQNVNLNAGLSVLGGNINFTVSSQRIKGRFYGTPHSNRTLFTANAAAQDCIIGCLPTAVGGAAGIGYYGNNDPDNASILYIAAGPTSTGIQAAHSGAGATQPINVAIDATIAMSVLTDTKIIVNGASNVTGCQFQVNGMASRETGLVTAHRNGVAFNIADSTWTKINFTTEEFDRKGWFDLANDRFQPTVPGDYLVSAGSGAEGAGVAGKRIQLAIYKNGVIYKTLGAPQFGGNTDAMLTQGAAMVNMNGGADYIEFFAWQDTGIAQSWSGQAQDTFIQIAHMG